MTRRLSRLAPALVAPFVLGATMARAQTPTPTPTPTGTPTPTPTPTPIAFAVPASSSYYGIPSGGRYDAANVVLGSDGSVWAASANENVVAKLATDRVNVTRWKFPVDAAPSYLLPNEDGTFWVTQLGGFKVSLFDPSTGTLREWADSARRPTALARKRDGTLWLPETNGSLASFDPATGTFTYYRSNDTALPISNLSYPFLDDDGSLWVGDFGQGALLRYAPDGSKATRWALPDRFSQPSKVIKGFDGKIWVSLYASSQVARFDPATNELTTWTTAPGALPFELKNWRDRILFCEQQYGEIGVLDPYGKAPDETKTLEPKEVSLVTTTSVSSPTTTSLESTTAALTYQAASILTGVGYPGISRFPAGIGAVWGFEVDDARGRIVFGTSANVAYLTPPTEVNNQQIYFPAASSIGGADGTRWATQVVAWNRGTIPTATPTTTPTPTATPTPTPTTTPTVTPTATPVPGSLSVTERLLPTGWIVGLSPSYTQTIEPNWIVDQPDAIGNEMGGPDLAGGLTLFAATGGEELFAWARFYRTAEGGGTYGFARNGVKKSAALTKDGTAFFFTPPDGPSARVNAGVLVMEAASGTATLVAGDGATIGSVSFEWPEGYQYQWSDIFGLAGIAPLPSARVVFALQKGRILPYGIAIDTKSRDPMGLELMGPGAPPTVHWITGACRNAGPLGAGARTDLQLYNPGQADVEVALVFRAARLEGAAPPTSTEPPYAYVTVPAGKVLTVPDALGTIGLSSGYGLLEVVSDPGVHAFARLTAPAIPGGRHGAGLRPFRVEDAISDGTRGIFINVTDAGADVMETELVLLNPTENPASVTLNLTAYDGSPAGSKQVALGPKDVLSLPAVWYSISGFGAPIGRLDVVPDPGSPPVFAATMRQDKKTRDVDVVTPLTAPK